MNVSAKTILLVEDNENDIFFMRRALNAADIHNPLQVVTDGQSATEYLSGAGEFGDRQKYPMPILIFLDLKLPQKSGLDVLKWMRHETALRTIVLVLTTSGEPSDIERSFELGANAYLVKPSSFSELSEMMKAVKSFWLTFNRLP